MRITILFSVLAAVAFVATFFFSHDSGLACNVAGIVAGIYLIILIVKATKPPFPAGMRYVVIFVAVIGYGSVGTAWLTQYNLSHWQREMLLVIRGSINHARMSDALARRELRTLEAYHDQKKKDGKETFIQIFKKLNPPVVPGSNVLDTLSSGDKDDATMVLIYVSAQTDSSVTLTAELTAAQRQEPTVRLLGMNVWAPKVKLQMAETGGKYDLE
ncbi:MAG: hypothetical protein NTV54_00280 [Ignavibacteriales bacterium]|nr:hypothetical protein [Ignavibacteriales bacterium]